MSNISFQYPTWYLLLCIFLGLAFALGLYYRERTFREQATWLKVLLGVLRFLVVTTIAALLLSPLLKRLTTQTQKPIVVLAQDGSASVATALGEDGKAAYQASMEQLSQTLGEDYDLKTYTFGSEVREGLEYDFTDKSTNIADALSSVYDQYSNQNLGALILATDGIYNQGSNPIYASSELAAPVYTIALGDTTPQRDLIVKRVFHNRIAYLGDRFSMQVDLLADNAAGAQSRLSVYKVEGGNTRLLEQMPVGVNENNFFTTKEIILEADRAGVQRYRVVFSPVDGEASTQNNSKDVFIDVLDARQKVLILAQSPHPDIAALRQTLEVNKNYEIDTRYVGRFQENIAAYDFVILHQLPSRTASITPILNELKKQKTPHLFIVGTQTEFGTFNQAQPLVSIRAGSGNTNQVQARVEPSFNFFKISDEVKSELPNFAPLTAPFGDFQITGEGQVLLYQKIGSVETQYPLWMLGEKDGVKVGVLCAEGLWKWRLFDYLQHNNHDIFDEVVGKAIQYLGLKEDKRRFRASLPKNILDENEAIYFDAELYNESFELLNEPDVSLSVKDGDGKEYNYTFVRQGNAYSLNAGILPVGDYQYRATTAYNGEQFTHSGQFSVQPIQLEAYARTADHNLLRLLGQRYGGQVFYPDAIGQIAAAIAEQGTVKPVIYESTKTKPVIDLKWIFFFLLIALALEWFLRRYFGGY